MEASTPPLFERLPKDLFRPLAATNNLRYWDLLCRLMIEMWGDGGRSPGEEAPKTTVIRAIESFLVADDPWEDVESPITIRAHGIFNFFCESGWLSQRRRGVIDHVTVRPVVAQFFTVLTEFAHHKPEFLGGKVRSIFLNLREVSAGKAPELYPEAARQAKQCMAHIINTSCRVQDLMDVLVTKTTASEFVRGFFEEYIEKVFIADYSDFRTNNHPLQYRSDIVSLTLQFQHDANLRQSLITWYTEKQADGDLLRAEALYERDTRLLLRLRDVEEHLHRLDEEIRVAHQRAMAFFEYKLRSPGNFDKLIDQAISAAKVLEEGHIALPGIAGIYHASEFGLAKPRTPLREHVSTTVAEIVPTIEELAKEALRQRMNADRNVTPLKLAQYVARHLGDQSAIRSDELNIDSILDLCCYQRLLLIASRNGCPQGKRKSDPHLQMVPGMYVTFVPETNTRNEYMEHQQFVIRVGRK
ncbi:Wadjet anti-phage system protein JetA family protein [Pseudomonas mandelii]|uniref:Wadjet anti-phage system protein JetA family protein n=1 Tax=Pseudomonas mandelii TaxID=75612 RepID=UPI00209CF770|nr:Wadjet anti-phage system protein JetA family protein [Pseudomonas mandelii]MCO8310829.1 DUF5716 family protein [Pseudomonas mandelii]